MERQETTYALGDTGLTARIVLSRKGQQPAGAGDLVSVLGELYLPVTEVEVELKEDADFAARSKAEGLHPAICFDRRVQVMGDDLDMWWGLRDEGARASDKMFFAYTWEEAFAAADRVLREELQKLQAALAGREAALAAAELPAETKI